MSPQPKAPDKPQEAPQAPQEAGNGPAPTDLSVFVTGLLEQGLSLQKDKEALFERITANRTMLRNLVTTGAATSGQVEAVDKLYPPRQKAEEGEKAADAPKADPKDSGSSGS